MRVRQDEDFAGGDAELKAAFAVLTHFLHLEASSLDAASKVVKRNELDDRAQVALVLVARRASGPVLARHGALLADCDCRFLEHRVKAKRR